MKLTFGNRKISGLLGVLPKNERTFVEVRMKQNGGFYTGELKSYGIVPDSEPNKDFLLVNAAYKKQESDTYVSLAADGVLLNFADAESISFIKETIA